MSATGLLAFFGFDTPRYLFLLITIPLLVWFSFRSLAGLGRIRRATDSTRHHAEWPTTR